MQELIQKRHDLLKELLERSDTEPEKDYIDDILELLNIEREIFVRLNHR